MLTINITLPDGKVIEGSSGRLLVYETTNGLERISTFYKPTSLAIDPFQYWTDGATNSSSDPMRRIHVVRKGYTLELFPAPEGEFQIDVRFPTSTNRIAE